ncbi:hypothetical protein [Rufibacter hautae]|uniref:Uncharacterized protein n=1 Tax=Rufibacter hautae TaxID=2595005 RepID=A0A5B6TB44_9BACT|nr:hypothetical protein [Rufibacter hautae]KAA3436201.1 hypothetical protein FOA19_17515 [Rufibacter hautae]
MFQLNAHVLPSIDSSQFGKAKGAYAIIFINYADIDGAYALAKFYIEEDGWVIDEIEDEYLLFTSAEDVSDEYQQYYHEALETGYSMLFNCYEKDDLVD